MENAGLIVVDVQNDFLPGGSLAVPDGDKIIPVVNRLMEQFTPDQIFLTRDTHPKDHGSFASNHPGKNVFDVIDLNGIKQVLWPDHCVIGTPGSKIATALEAPEDAEIVEKGMNPKYDSYSGFKDAGGQETGLIDELSARDISPAATLYVVGLATDYCVKATALDANEAGFKVRVVIDGCRGVTPGTTEQALAEMQDAGIEFVKSADLGTPIKPLD